MMTQEAIIIEEMIAIKATLILRDKLLLTTGVTLNSHLMANVGITYKPGKSNMTSHPQNLEARVQALETQNKELQEIVRQLMSKLDK